MTKRSIRGMHELYGHDPLVADERLWGRKAHPLTRRGFLKGSGLGAMSVALGASIPFASHMPGGVIPAALANSDETFEMSGKKGLIVLNDRPLNAETPAHLLDDEITPAQHLFVRNNGVPPDVKDVDPDSWTLSIEGESCERPRAFTLAELKARFKHYSCQLQLECGGNGRREFQPPAKGNQWSIGAVGCPSWTGARLRDVLEVCGIRDDAVYIGYYAADRHLSGDPDKVPISRGVPISKALEAESLIAWEMNGNPIPELHGYPLRLLCGGWPGSVSGKWLTKIVVRNRVHDGPKMAGQSYRVPCKPVAPGSKVADEDMCIIHSMPVKSLVTYPKSGITHPKGKSLGVRGHAWAGDLEVAKMFVSIDFGASWQAARLARPANRLSWQRWTAAVKFPAAGYYEVWARAQDSAGRSQPMVLPAWNPKGYLNNACHRIAVKVV